MKATILATILILSSFKTAYSAEVKVGYEFCKKFTKESVREGFAGRSLSGELTFNAYPFLNEDDIYHKYMKVGETVTAKMNAMCDQKKENVTLADMKESVDLECRHLCVVAFNSSDRERPLLGKIIKNVAAKANVKAAKTSEVCQIACVNSQNELELIERGMNLKTKPAATPDCTGVVSDKGRGIEVKAIEVNVDTGKTTIKTTGK